MNTDKIKLVLDTVQFPVQYHSSHQTIKDAKGMMVCDVRGWGKIQFMEKPEERQDAIGEILAHLLNQYKDSQLTGTKAPELSGMTF